jgi:uncharacterized membrane protein YtjA (UPF0391 family)
MLDWTLSFLIVAIIAGILGFTGIAGAAMEMAKVIFFISLILWLAAIVYNVLKGKGPKV